MQLVNVLIVELNDQVKKAEEQLKSDTQVESLEKEVSWFKEEKIRLQKNSDCMHQDLRSMSTKLKELHEQVQLSRKFDRTTDVYYALHVCTEKIFK
jgi:predicted nuclease with TOPRIM domain